MSAQHRAKRESLPSGVGAQRQGGAPMNVLRFPGQDAPEMADPDPTPPPTGPASFLQIAGAVFWSFFGVRKRAAMSRDLGSIKPQHVIAVGIVFAVIFVLTLVTVVKLITRGL